MQGIPVDGLLRVRALPNGRIDLLSIDEGTCLIANTIADMEARHVPLEPEEAARDTSEQLNSESDRR
jgi:hypothetical protein